MRTVGIQNNFFIRAVKLEEALQENIAKRFVPSSGRMILTPYPEIFNDIDGMKFCTHREFIDFMQKKHIVLVDVKKLKKLQGLKGNYSLLGYDFNIIEDCDIEELFGVSALTVRSSYVRRISGASHMRNAVSLISGILDEDSFLVNMLNGSRIETLKGHIVKVLNSEIGILRENAIVGMLGPGSKIFNGNKRAHLKYLCDGTDKLPPAEISYLDGMRIDEVIPGSIPNGLENQKEFLKDIERKIEITNN